LEVLSKGAFPTTGS